MGVKTNRKPYDGLWIFLPMMILPSVVITALLYIAISKGQSHLSQELNWASAKIFGCGAGVLFHISCGLMGVFTEDFRAVKKRLKEFMDNIVISARLAFTCYAEDVKTLGMAYWIDIAVVCLNIWVFLDAFRDYVVMRGLW